MWINTKTKIFHSDIHTTILHTMFWPSKQLQSEARWSELVMQLGEKIAKRLHWAIFMGVQSTLRIIYTINSDYIGQLSDYIGQFSWVSKVH